MATPTPLDLRDSIRHTDARTYDVIDDRDDSDLLDLVAASGFVVDWQIEEQPVSS